MIIRACAIFSLMATLILVLYVPSQRPPEYFLQQVRAEHERNVSYWGRAIAFDVLAAAINSSPRMPHSVPLMGSAPTPALPAGASKPAPVQKALGGIGARLADNAYLRSVNALLRLATYRLLFMFAFVPALLVFLLAALVDGQLRRVVRSKQFQQHNPELFALNASMVIVLLCAAVIACAYPANLHPALLPATPFVVTLFMALAVGHYHRR